MANRLPGVLVFGSALAFAACGGEGLTLPPEGEAAHIEVIRGDEQENLVGSVLRDTLFVAVTDVRGRPVPDATVNFTFPDGDATAAPATATTNSDGIAWARVTLGTQVGPVTGLAEVPVDQGIQPVQATFTAVALAAGANRISLVSGDPQSAPVGSELPAPLVVLVTDEFGNPIPNVPINWTITGGGSVSAVSTLTGADGQTSVTRTLGATAGQQTTQASAEGLAGSPITFTHTAGAGTATTVVKISGDVGAAPAGSVVELVVEVRDANNNPVVGAPVTWIVGEGNGSASPTSNSTNGEGRATTQWTLGSAPGTNTLNVVSSGGATTRFTITGTGTGSPSTLAVTTEPPSPVTVGATLTPGPVVQVRDAAGNDVAVAGVEITAGLVSGSGSLGGTRTVSTDANGRAQFSDLRVNGATGTHRLIFAADGFRSARSNNFTVSKASTTTAIAGHSPEPSDPNQPVTVTFTVTSSAGTPTGDVRVTVSNSSANCTGTLSQGSGTCQLTGLTSSGTLTATYEGDNLFATSSGEASHTVNSPPPPPPNTPPTANDDPFSVRQGETLIVGFGPVLSNDSDPEQDRFTLIAERLTTIPVDKGEIRDFDTGGSFEYRPSSTAVAGDVLTFTYQVRDSQNAVSNSATITITITAP